MLPCLFLTFRNGSRAYTVLTIKWDMSSFKFIWNQWLIMIRWGHSRRRELENLPTMMTTSNANIFLVTGPLCGEFTGDRWIPLIKASNAELWRFLRFLAWTNGWVNHLDAGDYKSHCAHYYVTVMTLRALILLMPICFSMCSPRRKINILSYSLWNDVYI